MIIKNPEKLLKHAIVTVHNQIWFVTDLNVQMDENGVRYIYKLGTTVPVKSSPNQHLLLHYSRTIEQEVTLSMNIHTYQLQTPELVLQGYYTDMDTMDKFINRLGAILPITDN
jgi:hypothetical protein